MTARGGINDFLDMMTAKVTVAPFVSRDTYGKPTYGVAVPYQARVNYETHFIRGPQGESIVSRGIIWVATSSRITDKDKITLPDGTAPSILQVAAVTDENSVVLYNRVDFG